MSKELLELLKRSVERFDALHPAEKEKMLRAQRRSFIRAEAAFGSDQDEAAYKEALANGDEMKRRELDAAAAARVKAVEKLMEDSDL